MRVLLMILRNPSKSYSYKKCNYGSGNILMNGLCTSMRQVSRVLFTTSGEDATSSSLRMRNYQFGSILGGRRLSLACAFTQPLIM